MINMINVDEKERSIKISGVPEAGPQPASQSRVGKSSTFLIFSSNFDQFFLKPYYFLPHFGPPGGRLAHPGRPWLLHWSEVDVKCPSVMKPRNNIHTYCQDTVIIGTRDACIFVEGFFGISLVLDTDDIEGKFQKSEISNIVYSPL